METKKEMIEKLKKNLFRIALDYEPVPEVVECEVVQCLNGWLKYKSAVGLRALALSIEDPDCIGIKDLNGIVYGYVPFGVQPGWKVLFRRSK